MNKLITVVTVLVLSGCAGAETRDTSVAQVDDFQPDSRPLGKTFVYECTGMDFISRVGPGQMALWLEDRYIILSQVRSASGTKYVEGDVVFWSKGDEVLLEVDGRRYSDCEINHARAPWEDARRRGVDFRAVGNEPGWHLEIREGENLLYVGDYGASRILLPQPTMTASDGERVYTAGEGDEMVRVVVTDSFCTDTMKGNQFPLTVQLQYQGRDYQGCGRDLDYPWE